MTEPPDDYLRQVVLAAKRVWRGEIVEMKVVKTTKGVHMFFTNKKKFELEPKGS